MKTRVALLLSLFLAILAACTDAAAPEPAPGPLDTPLPTAFHSQLARSSLVLDGTYDLKADNNVVSWTLSANGTVFIPLELGYSDVLSGIRIRGTSQSDPTVRIIDQVESNSGVLKTLVAGSIRDTGVVTYELEEQLTLLSPGEVVLVKITTGPDRDLDLYTVSAL